MAGVPKVEVSWPLKKQRLLESKPIGLATSDPHELEKAFQKITSLEWERLEEGISQLKHPLKKGLYEINPTIQDNSNIVEETDTFA
jgi:hypothetical protein